MRGMIRMVSGVAGLIGAAALAAGMAAAVSAYVGFAGEGYSPLNHFVSELGEVAASPNAPVFNLCLIIGGLCMAVCTLGVGTTFRAPWRYLFSLAGVLAGVSGALVGMFPMDDFPRHIAVALTFFTSGLGTITLFSLYALRAGAAYPRSLAYSGFPIAAIFLLTLILAWQTPLAAMAYPARFRPDVWPVTVFEWLSITLVLVWIAAVALHTLRGGSASTPPQGGH